MLSSCSKAFSLIITVALTAAGGCVETDDPPAEKFTPGSDAGSPVTSPETSTDGDDAGGSDSDETAPDTSVAPEAGGDAGADTEADAGTCGNGVREPGEACDDGNNDETDGCLSSCETTAIPVALADDAEAELPIVVPPGASETLRSHAETLRSHLDKITGGDFSIIEGDGSEGIALGRPDEVAAPELPDLAPSSAFDREDYLIRTHRDGIHLVGATELAVRHAVWDLLRRAGYRHYFPGDAWEIVPDRPNLALAADELESPAFVWRHLAFSYGSWDNNERRLEAWQEKNRADGGFQLRAGHAWQDIIRANRETFENHPEYVAGDDPSDVRAKLCVTQPEVQQIAADWAIDWLEDHPDEDSVAMDPSDGGNWEGCPGDDKQLGSPSNRAVFLANKVAEAINAHFDETKYVGLYAYNEHQWAPTIEIDDRVIPSVATAFLQRGNTAEELFQSWSKAGAKRLGLYGYYNVTSWSDDLPGEQRASSPTYVEESMRRYYEAGARFFHMETSDGWGPTGLGHWMSIRLAWELDETPGEQLRDDLRDDFLSRAFGQASEPMETFYTLLDRDHELLLSDHLVGEMYRLLERALNQTHDSEVQARIRELALYTRYVDLYRDYKYDESAERQDRFEKLIRFAYRIHDTHMVHSLARYLRLADNDDAVTIPEEAGWRVDEADNPWKSSEPFSNEQIRGFIEQGIADHPLRDFQPRTYSRDLVPAAPLGLDSSKRGKIRARGSRHDDLEGGELNEAFDEFARAQSLRDTGIVPVYTWIPEQVATPFGIDFSVSAENIHGSATGGELPVELFELSGSGQASSVDSSAIPVDRDVHRRTVVAPRSGLYRLDLSGQDRFFDIRMRNESPELHQTYEMSPEQWVHASNRGSYLFYVPEGTDTIGGYATPGAPSGDAIERPDGSVALDFADMERPGYFSVDVPEGADGKLWKLDDLPSRDRFLMTVPPQVADSPDELLLPREVVEADSD